LLLSQFIFRKTATNRRTDQHGRSSLDLSVRYRERLSSAGENR
jgi:hypothetical protein